MVSTSIVALVACLLGGPAAALKAKDRDPRCDGKNRVDAARALEKDFNHHFRGTVIEQFRMYENDTLILTVGERRLASFFENFVSKFENVLQKDRKHAQVLVHAALDQESLESCQKITSESNFMTLRCLDLRGWVPASVLASSEMERGSCAHSFFSWTRPLLLYAAVQGSRKGAVFVDHDLVPYRNLVPALELHALKHEDEMVQMVTSRAKTGAVSTGIVWAKKWSVGILKQWLIDTTEMINMKTPDQAALQKQFFTKPELKDMHSVLSTMAVGTCQAKGSIATHYSCDPKQAIKDPRGAINVAAGNLESGRNEISKTIAIMKQAQDWAI